MSLLKGSNSNDEFKSFIGDYTQLYPGMDGVYPTQLHLMDRFKMGVTLQKFDTDDNEFNPEELDLEYNNSSGSSTTIGSGGNIINSKYNSIAAKKKDCPN